MKDILKNLKSKLFTKTFFLLLMIIGILIFATGILFIIYFLLNILGMVK